MKFGVRVCDSASHPSSLSLSRLDRHWAKASLLFTTRPLFLHRTLNFVSLILPFPSVRVRFRIRGLRRTGFSPLLSISIRFLKMAPF